MSKRFLNTHCHNVPILGRDTSHRISISVMVGPPIFVDNSALMVLTTFPNLQQKCCTVNTCLFLCAY